MRGTDPLECSCHCVHLSCSGESDVMGSARSLHAGTCHFSMASAEGGASPGDFGEGEGDPNTGQGSPGECSLFTGHTSTGGQTVTYHAAARLPPRTYLAHSHHAHSQHIVPPPPHTHTHTHVRPFHPFPLPLSHSAYPLLTEACLFPDALVSFH